MISVFLNFHKMFGYLYQGLLYNKISYNSVTNIYTCKIIGKKYVATNIKMFSYINIDYT